MKYVIEYLTIECGSKGQYIHHEFTFQLLDDENNLQTKIALFNPCEYSKNVWLDFINEKLTYGLIFGKNSFLSFDIIKPGILDISNNMPGSKGNTYVHIFIPIAKIKDDLLSAIEKADKNGMWV